MKFQTAYGERVRPTIDTGEGLTKQALKDQCDINLIMKRYVKTGLIEHSRRFSGEYAFATGLEFQEALELIRQAEEMFAELPATVRREFDNRPDQFLAFVQDPANGRRLEELGLIEHQGKGIPPAVPEPTPADPGDKPGKKSETTPPPPLSGV